MIITVCSSKGSPGVTATALAIAAVWPREVLLVEADPSGGDLAYRCASAAGGPLAAAPSLIGLAAAARSHQPGVLSEFAQELACGVPIIQGVATPAQGRGLANLWPTIVDTMNVPGLDVIIDVGRLDRADSTMAFAAASDRVLVAHTSSMESVMHTREALLEYTSAIDSPLLDPRLVPLMIGPARHASADRRDVNTVYADAGLPVAPAAHLPLDRPALDRLEGGERAGGRLSRTLLLRAAATLVNQLTTTTSGGSA